MGWTSTISLTLHIRNWYGRQISNFCLISSQWRRYFVLVTYSIHGYLPGIQWEWEDWEEGEGEEGRKKGKGTGSGREKKRELSMRISWHSLLFCPTLWVLNNSACNNEGLMKNSKEGTYILNINLNRLKYHLQKKTVLIPVFIFDELGPSKYTCVTTAQTWKQNLIRTQVPGSSLPLIMIFQWTTGKDSSLLRHLGGTSGWIN